MDDDIGHVLHFIAATIVGVFTCIAFALTVVAGLIFVIIWTVAWIALKIATTAILLPPALLLSRCCGIHGPKELLDKMPSWGWVFPKTFGKLGRGQGQGQGPDPGPGPGPQGNAAGADNTAQAEAQAQAQAEAPNRDVELGTLAEGPNRPQPGMETTGAPPERLGGAFESGCGSVHVDPDEPPPAYEEIESGRHIWG